MNPLVTCCNFYYDKCILAINFNTEPLMKFRDVIGLDKNELWFLLHEYYSFCSLLRLSFFDITNDVLL